MQVKGLGAFYDFCFVQRTGRKADGVALFTLRQPHITHPPTPPPADTKSPDSKHSPPPAANGSASDHHNNSSGSGSGSGSGNGSGWIEWIGTPHAIHFRDVGNRIAVLLHCKHHFRVPTAPAAVTTGTSTGSGSTGSGSGSFEWCTSELLLCGTHLTVSKQIFTSRHNASQSVADSLMCRVLCIDW